MSETSEYSGPSMEKPLRIDSTIVRAAIISETLVFCTLALLAGGLFALVVTTNLNWFYPVMFYVVVAYIAWQRYFSISITDENGSETSTQASTQVVATTPEEVAAAVLAARVPLEEVARRLRDQEPEGESTVRDVTEGLGYENPITRAGRGLISEEEESEGRRPKNEP